MRFPIATRLPLFLLAPCLAGGAALAQLSGVRTGGAQGSVAQVAPGQRQDVVLIVLDDINWLDVDAIPTPSLDRLMAAGTTWRRFYTMPVCSPTRYALQFGRWPRRDGILNIIESANGVAGLEPYPEHDLVSLGDLFKGRGYMTGIFGKWHTGLQFYGVTGTADPYLSPLFMGYDTWRAGTTGNPADFFDWSRLDDGNETAGITEYSETILVDEVNAWFAETAAKRRPRFAFVAFHLAHLPLHAPPAQYLPPGHPAPTTQRETWECMVMAADTLLDRLIRFDDQDPDGEIDLREDLVVVVGDNGTPTPVALPQVAGRAKGTIFEGGILCPLVVSGPGFEEGRVEEQALASPVDLFATFGAWLGTRLPGRIAEDSIPLQSRSRRWVLSERVDSTKGDQVALIEDSWKLFRTDGIEVVYDLSVDPLEQSPLDPDDPALTEVVASLRAIEAGLPPRE